MARGTRKFLYYLSAAVLLAVAVVVANAVREQVTQAIASPRLAVDVSADRHLISPDIYGMNSYNVDSPFPKSYASR
jgi:hypothetical protein